MMPRINRNCLLSIVEWFAMVVVAGIKKFMPYFMVITDSASDK